MIYLYLSACDALPLSSSRAPQQQQMQYYLPSPYRHADTSNHYPKSRQRSGDGIRRLKCNAPIFAQCSVDMAVVCPLERIPVSWCQFKFVHRSLLPRGGLVVSVVVNLVQIDLPTLPVYRADVFAVFIRILYFARENIADVE